MRRIVKRTILAGLAIFAAKAIGATSGISFAISNSTVFAQEIGYLEEFALAENRETALQRLIPGTEDYYFFHCLHYQHTGQLDKVDELLATWINRLGYTAQVNQIRNRQALLKYGDDPSTTLTFLQQQLNLNFNHQREIPQAQLDLPSVLDPQIYDAEKLTTAARARYQNSDGFTDRGLRLLASAQPDKIQLRHLLERLVFPDFPDLVNLIVRDLKEQDSRPFGNLAIHSALTLKQLDELVKQLPQLADQTSYVNIYINKLAPRDDTNWRVDVDAHQKYLDRLWVFAKQLPATHNSLKANILFRKLDLDRSQGTYNRDLFLTYLKLPRNVVYINPTLIKDLPAQNQIADLNQDFNALTRLAPIFDDEPLVSEYLYQFLLAAEDTKAFQPFLEYSYLQQQFATVKILNGVGDAEQWASMLPPQRYQQLFERVDLDFLATNPEHFSPGDEVALGLYTKNVKTLIVKIFEINTENYYRKHQSEIDTDINLDGLVANSELTYTYDTPPALRVKREFKFPQLEKRGVYVIDFIAGGKSSRALIRKGRLQIINRSTAAGHLFSVLDESGAVVVDASLWISGRRFLAAADGRIQVPFSTQPGRAAAIITQGDFSCLQSFEHVAEKYSFNAAMVIDRESLVPGNQSKILLRPILRIEGGDTIPLSMIEEPKLHITTENLDGLSATKTIADLKLNDSEDTVCEFMVPPRLKSIALSFTGKITNLSRGETNELAANRTYTFNEIDSTKLIQDLHLAPTETGFVIEVRGKTGELRPQQPVHVSLQMLKFQDAVEVDLQSDEKGQVVLGELNAVDSITARSTNGTTKSWSLTTESSRYPQSINSLTSDEVEVPAPADWKRLNRESVSLLERRRGTFVADWFDAISLDAGLLKLKRLKAGDYVLRISAANQSQPHEIEIRVTAGKPAAQTFVGKHRILENRGSRPLAVQSVQSDGEQITVKLTNSNPHTRVHIFAGRYRSAFDMFDNFAQVRDIEPWLYQPAIRQSAYMEGRKIGDEYQYILDRKYATKYPGNLLDRPSLLLNPWATQTTDNRTQDVADGSDFGGAGSARDGSANRKQTTPAGTNANSDFANLDFLGGQSVVVANLQPDDSGTLTIDRKQLGANQHIRIFVLDGLSTVQQTVNLPLESIDPRDGRLVHALNVDTHFVQRKQIQLLKKGEQLKIEDLVSAKFQAYDDLGDVFRLLATLNPNADLEKFEFILTWHELAEEKKQELYSKFACHELNFWLFKKDTQFFESVVAKHLVNKRDQTFLDRWLLKDDLTEFIDPWKYARLNCFERILLAQALDKHSSDIIRNIRETYAMTPTSRSEFDVLYDATIGGLSLDVNDLDKYTANARRRLLDVQGGNRRTLEESKSEYDSSDAATGYSFGAVTESQPAEPMAPAAPGDAMESHSGARMKSTTKDLPTLGPPLARLEARTRQVPITKMRTEIRERILEDGTIERTEVAVPYTEMVTQDYTVQVPETEWGSQLLSTEQLSELRDQSRRFYRRLPPTQQWMENNYYQRLPADQTPNLVTANRFWQDYANFKGDIFTSPYFPEAHRTFTEMMFVLAVLDLPWQAPEQELEIAENQLTFTAAGATIVFYQQIQPAAVPPKNTTILISENVFQHDDRYRYEDNVRFDKFLTDQFRAHTLYGSQVVISNPTSTPRSVELLIQIPAGSIAIENSQETKTIPLDLDAFSTKTVEYSFYFPTAGKFGHYPAHISADEQVLAVAESIDFEVLDQPAATDKSSWAFISQNGSDEEVFEFLKQENILRLDLEKIAFRMVDRQFYLEAIDTLRSRFVFNQTLWAYSVKHNDPTSLQEFLEHADQIANHCGPCFESQLLTLDPVQRDRYQHREYWPLLNARFHQLGPQRRILNPNFFSQYQQLLSVLAYRPALTNDDHLIVTYYMLLQDRIETAMQHFELTNADSMPSKIQYDYCDAYLDLYREQPDAAAKKAQPWADYPVDLWRNRFENILAQVAEIRGEDAAVVDPQDQAQQQTELAASSPTFEFEIKDGEIQINSQNLEQLAVNFYEMDIELLFSRSPFAQNERDGFSMIRPNSSQSVELKLDDKGRGTAVLKLPKPLQNKNVLIEVVAGDQTKSETYFAHSFELQMLENYGQLHIADAAKHEPIPKTYVKVYSRTGAGIEQFHKDGYTDLRGRFDYVSQSNQSLDGIEAFSVLILSDQHGAIIRQVKPPQE